MGDHGGVRRPDARDRALRHRSAAALGDRAGARTGLSGVRDFARADRSRAGDRRAPRGDLLLLRGHAARAGSNGDLLARKAQGADVRIVYSPLDALELALRNPERWPAFCRSCACSNAATPASRTAMRDRCPNAATRPHSAHFKRCSRSATGSGAVSARSQERLSAALRVPRARRRAALRRRRDRSARARRVHQRSGAARREEAARVPGVRVGLHAGSSARSHHGVVGGRVRGVLRVPA